MKKLIAILAVSFLGLSAHAADNDTEFFYQPESGGMDLELGYSYLSFEIDGKSGGTTDFTYSETTNTLDAKFSYGFSDMFALGATLGYTTGESEVDPGSTTDISGLEDIALEFLGRMAAGPGSFRFGVDASVNLEDVEVDQSGSTSERNVSDGRMEAGVYAGYDFVMGSHIIGASAATQLLAGEYDKVTKTGSGETTTTLEGGKETSIDLFYENKSSDSYRWGAAFNYEMTGEVENASSGAVSDTESTIMAVTAYSRWEISDGLAILPELTYIASIDQEDSGTTTYDGGSGYSARLAGRFSF